MHLPFYVLPCLAIVFEALLLWRLLVNYHRHSYPYLLLFVIFTLVRDVGLFPIFWWKPGWFLAVYWRTEVISLLLRFSVIWEFFRGLFTQHFSLYQIAWKTLLVVEFGLLPIVVVGSWRQASTLHLVFLPPNFEQYLSLAQALLLLAPAAVARYYGLQFDRHMRGLGLGFGVYLSVCAINFASVQVSPAFRPYCQLISPITFIGMIALWLLAFWEYAPAGTSESAAYVKDRCERTPSPAAAETVKRWVS